VVRDIMLPGALKSAFQAEITARQEARAELERARGEAAVLRSMANTAQLLEKSPQLIQLKLLQTLAATSGNTIVVDAAGQFGAVSERAGGQGIV
jgi:regulator of protease activity HflC (stomatin/prohibitin superfamily)